MSMNVEDAFIEILDKLMSLMWEMRHENPGLEELYERLVEADV